METLYNVTLREMTTRKYVIKANSASDATTAALACHEYQVEDGEFLKIHPPQESTGIEVEVFHAKT